MAPLVWTLTLMTVGFVAGSWVGLPTWGLILLGSILAIFAANFLAFAWYLVLKDPDALRSERFALTRMAMHQKNFRGDKLVGFVRALGDDGGERSASIEPVVPATEPDDRPPAPPSEGHVP